MSDKFDQYRFLFENMAQGAFFQEADGTLSDVNQAALVMLGLTRDQFIGRTSLHPEWRVIDSDGCPLPPELHPSMISLQSGKPVRDFVAGVFHPQRQEFIWVQISSTPMFRTGETTPYRVAVTIHDMTEQRLMEVALKRSEQLFRRFFDLPLVGSSISTPGKGWLAINDKLCDIFGYSREELMTMSWTDLTHPEDLAEDLASFERVMSGEMDGYTLDKRFIRKDGKVIWASIAVQCIRGADGRVEFFAALAQDITEQKQAALAIEQSEKKYRQLHESMMDGFALIDMDGNLLEWNESFRQMLGYSPEELIGLTYRDITPEKWHDAETRILTEEVMQKGFSRVYEKEYIHKDGSIFPVELRTCLIRDHSGRASGMWAIIRDISDRKMTEKALRESEERYRRFIATANEGIGIVNSSYVITYVNRSLAVMLGYEAYEMIGRQVASMLHPEELPHLAETIDRQQRGLSGQQEFRHRRKDGTEIWLLTSMTPILAENGEFQGSFAMFSDLTSRKLAETILQQTNDELEQRVKERTADLASANEQIRKMSFNLVHAQEQERARIAAELHDNVGQMLLLCKMKLDMLADRSGSAVAPNDIDAIVSLLGSSIHDIRTLTFNMRPPLLETAGLEAALEWLCQNMAENYNLQIEFTHECKVVYLTGEQRYLLYQIIRELLLNVAKHAGVDRATLSLSKEINGITVTVADRGIGFTTDGERSWQESNCGFGLFNIQQRIEILGGSITIETSPGQGTTVTMNIPRTQR